MVQMDERPLNAAATICVRLLANILGRWRTDKARWDCRPSDEQKTAKQLHAYCQLGEGLIKLLI